MNTAFAEKISTSILKDEFDKQYYLELREFLIKEYKSHLIYPDKYKIFEAGAYSNQSF